MAVYLKYIVNSNLVHSAQLLIGHLIVLICSGHLDEIDSSVISGFLICARVLVISVHIYMVLGGYISDEHGT